MNSSRHFAEIKSCGFLRRQTVQKHEKNAWGKSVFSVVRTEEEYGFTNYNPEVVFCVDSTTTDT